MPKTSVDIDRYTREVLGLSDGVQKGGVSDIANHEYLMTRLNPDISYLYVSENDVLSHLYLPPSSDKFGEVIVKRTVIPCNELMYFAPIPREYVHIPSSTLSRNCNWRSRAIEVFEQLRHTDAKEAHTKTITNVNSGTRGYQVVKTPSSLYSLLDTWFGFDYDPCPVKPEKDAMTSEWGMRNFVNPPFSSVQAFIMRAIEQARDKSSMSVLLVPVLWMKSTWGYGILVDYIQYISGCVFLRRGVSFDGYGKGVMPLPMMLLIVQRGGAKPNGIPIEFVDPLPPERRRVKTGRHTDMKRWLSRIGVTPGPTPGPRRSLRRSSRRSSHE